MPSVPEGKDVTAAPVADLLFVERLRRLAADLNIVALGVTTAAPFDDMAPRLARRHEAGRKSQFEPAEISRRIDPEQILLGSRAIIAIAVSYHAGSDGKPILPPLTNRVAPSQRPDPDALYDNPNRRTGAAAKARGAAPGPWRGWISRHAWGRDYHRVIREKLTALADFITDAYPMARCAGYVDTGPTVDRAVAERAGIGWTGKNCCIFVPGTGSWVVLGTLLTTLALPPDEPSPPAFQECRDCDLCIRACPTGALLGPGELDPTLCLAEAGVLKGGIPSALRAPLGNRIYGCDTCQQVCPYNRGKSPDGDEAFLPVGSWDTGPDLAVLIGMTKGDWRRHYGGRASGWRGKSVTQRNVVIALGNYRDPAAVPLLGRILQADVRPTVRGAAAWSLGRVGTAAARDQLVQSRADERDPVVMAEIDAALDSWN